MEKTAKTTKRAIIEGILEMFETGAWNGITKEEAVAYLTSEREQLDKKAVKAKERAAAKKEESDEMTTRIYEDLDAEKFYTIDSIVDDLSADYPEITPRKVASRLGKLVAANRVEKSMVSVEQGEGEKARKLQGYRRIG